MTKAMTNETPVKVLSLLGVALASMAFLFTVTVTDASFEGAEYAIPDPFAVENVVAFIDNVSNGYSDFLRENLISPAQADYAMIADNVAWIAENSQDGLYAMLGVEDVVEVQTQVAQQPVTPRVAGASTESVQQPAQSNYGLIDVLYTILIQ